MARRAWTRCRSATRPALEGDNVAAMVSHTGATAANGQSRARGRFGCRIDPRSRLGCGVGAPIIVDGRLWGAAIVGSLALNCRRLTLRSS